jgi:ribosomal protein S18 acetylase RimI-like enzyme
VTVEVALLPPSAADDEALTAELTGRINAAYGAAEEELWAPGTDRVEHARVVEIVRAGEMAVARLDGRIVGSIRVRDVEDRAGYFGLLAVEPAAQGRGVGRALIELAERTSRDRGATSMELRLLVPREGTDPGKSKLYDWYGRLGYEEVERGDFGESHPAAVGEWRTPLDVLTMRKRL